MVTAEKSSIFVLRRDELLAERGFDFLVFRADDTGRLVSGFPQNDIPCDGKSVYNCCFKGTGKREYILKMLSGFSRSPFLINTDYGCALIIRSMAPVSNLCAALILGASAGCINKLAAAGAFDLVILPPGPCGLTDGSSKNGGKYIPDPHLAEKITSAYRYAKGGFYSCTLDNTLSDSVEKIRKISETVRCLAYLSFCSCTFYTDERVYNISPSGVYRKFDSDIFTVFTMLSLLACGRLGLRREANFKYTFYNGEPVIEIEAELIYEAAGFPEFDECRRIADRRRLYYECSVIRDRNRNKVRIRFSPVRYDWSVLGVKSGARIAYD
jgi:hypothetical protein